MDPREFLKKIFGYSSFRGCQLDVINHILSGNHAMLLMPTGMGKSVCYQIPALILPGLTLVISPLIALMKDQVDNLHRREIDATFINSSLNRCEREKRLAALRQGACKLLYVTPERFRKAEFTSALAKRTISLLAVDEAHCISKWGHDFRPDYSRIGEIRNQLGNPTTLALTATATPDVQKDIIAGLGLSEASVKIFHEGIDRPNLQLFVEPVYGDAQKLDYVVNRYRDFQGSTIIYFSLIKTLERFSALLKNKKINHLCYHGGMNGAARQNAQNLFMSDRSPLILATNAFGMGVDKADIRHIIHAEVPGSMEAYYQEIGRAGRDGELSDCTLLYDENDLLIQMDFIRWNNPDQEFYLRFHQLITDYPEAANSGGIDWLKEKLHYKNRFDFRLETALAMFDRYEVTEGSLAEHNLKVLSTLPEEFSRDKIAKKILADQKKLHFMVCYIKTKRCRKSLIHEYFGIPYSERCEACDNCRRV